MLFFFAHYGCCHVRVNVFSAEASVESDWGSGAGWRLHPLKTQKTVMRQHRKRNTHHLTKGSCNTCCSFYTKFTHTSHQYLKPQRTNIGIRKRDPHLVQPANHIKKGRHHRVLVLFCVFLQHNTLIFSPTQPQLPFTSFSHYNYKSAYFHVIVPRVQRRN